MRAKKGTLHYAGGHWLDPLEHHLLHYYMCENESRETREIDREVAGKAMMEMMMGVVNCLLLH